MEEATNKSLEENLFEGVVNLEKTGIDYVVDYSCDPCDGCSRSCGGCSSYMPDFNYSHK